MGVNVLIAGGGLFGRIIALHLNDLGHNVTVIGIEKPETGLSAAGCLMKPSWTSKIPRRDECLKMLGNLIGVREVPFKIINPVNVFVEDCWALDKTALLTHPEFKPGGGVTWIEQEIIGIHYDRGVVLTKVRSTTTREWEVLEHSADVVIECMGAWSPHAKARYGVSFEHRGEFSGRIKPWRPFTQLVGFNISPDWVWAGDGTALSMMGSFDIQKSQKRVENFTGAKAERVIVGRRPYSIGKTNDPCHMFEDGMVKVVTGGAKNGTIAAAWAALMIGEELS